MSGFDPEHIAISKSGGIRIDWKDGHHSQYGIQFLRDRCPCASCTGAHGPAPEQPAPFAMYKPKLKMQNVKPVNGYAVRIRWNDEHDTGIFTFDYLRGICPCGKCGTT